MQLTVRNVTLGYEQSVVSEKSILKWVKAIISASWVKTAREKAR